MTIHSAVNMGRKFGCLEVVPFLSAKTHLTIHNSQFTPFMGNLISFCTTTVHREYDTDISFRFRLLTSLNNSQDFLKLTFQLPTSKSQRNCNFFLYYSITGNFFCFLGKVNNKMRVFYHYFLSFNLTKEFEFLKNIFSFVFQV